MSRPEEPRHPSLPRAIFLDLDGTLFDRDAAVRAVFGAQHQAFEAVLGGIAREPFVDRLLALDAHGHGDKRAAYGTLVRELGLHAELAGRLLQHFYEIYPGFGTTFPDVLPTLAELRRRGLALGLLTNGRSVTQQGKLRRLGLEPLFDVTLISEGEGVRKPERAFFERALQRTGVAAARAWHVGDHPTADVAGASAAGLTAIWRYVPYWPEPAAAAATVHALAELLPLLDAAARA
ncbi:MAG TPA: HAD family hydrolase [Polyangiaceae bacterium]|nr:HAD family hydrolase [Polyangiaceae bacterium]